MGGGTTRFSALLAVFCLWMGPSQGLTVEDLEAQAYREMLCTFRQRCVINLPCEAAWRDHRWYLNDAKGAAYRVFRGGTVSRTALLMPDQRWKGTSEALAILMPMREAVASHLTVFDGGGAIYSVQYAANPGAGQFFLGQCAMSQTPRDENSSADQAISPSE